MLWLSSWGARVSEGFWNKESSTSKFSLIVFLLSPTNIMDEFKLTFSWSKVLITYTKRDEFACCCSGNACRFRDYSGAPAARSQGRQAESHIHMGNKGKPMSWFSHGYHGLSGIAHGRVRTTTATRNMGSRNMAAILQVMDWQSYAALVYCIFLWYWTSMLWSIDTSQNKVAADQYHVTISTTHQGLVFFEVHR